MTNQTTLKHQILYRRGSELIRVTSPHQNAIRFEAFPGGELFEENFTLLPVEQPAQVEEGDRCLVLHAGTLNLKLEENGKITVSDQGRILLEEKPELTFEDGYRHYEDRENGRFLARITFKPNPDEQFFGMGHEAHGCLNLKGCSIDLRQINAKCTIPYYYSSLGYGFIWNNPGIGLAELGTNRTRWTARLTRKIDFVVLTGTPAQACETLADLTGHAPVMPHWATGFWQSRLRYESQEELLRVARRYHRENIPLSAIVCDYFHWTEQGDYRFNPELWPDIPAMTKELHENGVRLVVSMWPTVNEKSENYAYLKEHGLLIRTRDKTGVVFHFYGPQAEIDVTNPETRSFVFRKLKENYLDLGVDELWFDVAEPEIHPERFDTLTFHKGPGEEVALLYPYCYTQMAYEGIKSVRDEEPVTLVRCAYLGSQKYGALVWSGDIPSTFDSLRAQVKSGLNMSLCGIPWWNTDIGGFYGGDTTDPTFRELMVRWFQYGVFSPVMRLHGSRRRHHEPTPGLIEPSGDPNEIWSFGEENYRILRDLIFLRERLRPYIDQAMVQASVKGHPVMRPMFFDFPDDPACYLQDEQYMFGPDILFSPIVRAGQTKKKVYLPAGEWILTRDRSEWGPGTYEVDAKTDEFIAFVKKGASVLSCF